MKLPGLVFCAFLSLFAPHPFYLSVSDLKYNETSKKMEGSIKVFSSDLEDALKRIENKPVDLLHPKDKNAALAILTSYFQKRLSLRVNGKVLNYTLLGFETEEESLWIYLETETGPRPKKLEVENTILYDFLKEQMNIVNAEVGAQKKSWKLSNPEKQLSLEF